jgi:hypothetical protein
MVGSAFLVEAQHIGSSTDSIDARMRTAIALPAVALGAIKPVMDETTCKRASRVIRAANIGMPDSAPVYMVAVGTHYLALAPTPHGIVVNLDDQFAIKGMFMQPD